MSQANSPEDTKNLPSILPLIPIESSPVLPGLMASLHIPPGKSVEAVESAMTKNRVLGLLLPKSELKLLPPATNDGSVAPKLTYQLQDLYSRGVSVRILKKILMPDDSMNLLVHGLERFEVTNQIQKEPFLCANVKYFTSSTEKNSEIEALARSVIQQVKQLSASNPYFTEEMKIAMINAGNPGTLADMVAFTMNLGGNEAQNYIETFDVRERFLKLLIFLRKEKDMADIQRKLGAEVDSRVAKFQREFFLKEQLKSIKQELGMEEDDKSRDGRNLQEKINAANLPQAAKKVAEDELRRLRTIPETSPEYNLTRNYIEWIADLPWSTSTTDNLDLANARKVLDRGHYGLEDVKSRILEFLAVRALKPEAEGTILCFVGPPGVGKTSLGKAIAEALGRKFFRFSLGGMRDEAEIKGHRRTYVGAMPGKILQGLKRAGARNSLIMLDEIDKIGASYQGDPASALLEVLDPEQNKSFLDHYLDIPFDLSGVMFVANANSLHTIPPALLDRMEVIELPGYTLEEKEVIANRHVIPDSLGKHGLAKNSIRFPSETVRTMLKKYAREPGVRTLKQQVDRICRKVARRIVEKKSRRNQTVAIAPEQLIKWLGPERFHNEVAAKPTQAGVVTGLAWTSMGGEILTIEAIALPGTGELRLTGQMGDVMTESARIALSHVRKALVTKVGTKLTSLSRDEKVKVGDRIGAQDWFKSHDIHLHIPSGAVPKDGPSAGVTMASALLSLLTARLARPGLAMTGELSLVGKVLPVGGIREKVLAAKRAGIREIILPVLNKQDLLEIPKQNLRGLRFYFVENVDQVFRIALTPEVAKVAKTVVNRGKSAHGKPRVKSPAANKNQRRSKTL